MDDATLLEGLLNQAQQQWDIPPDSLLEYMDMIAFHESKNDPTAIQQSDITESGIGPGRGLYQYEVGKGQGAHTAINRLMRLTKNNIPDWAKELKNQNYDVSNLTPEQQKILFIADKLKDETASFKDVDTLKELAQFWADEHWAGEEALKESKMETFLGDTNIYNRGQ